MNGRPLRLPVSFYQGIQSDRFQGAGTYRTISAGSSRAGAGRSLLLFTAQPQEAGDAAGWLLSQPMLANPTARANSKTLSRILGSNLRQAPPSRRNRPSAAASSAMGEHSREP